MKTLAALLLAVVSFHASADSANTQVTCTSATHKGQVVTVEACVNTVYNGNGDPGVSSMTACPGEAFEFVTITRATNVAKMTPDMTETVKIPGRLFSIFWEEDGFGFNLNDVNAGKLSLEVTAGEDVNKFVIDIPAMKHSFKAVGCEFKEF